MSSANRTLLLLGFSIFIVGLTSPVNTFAADKIITPELSPITDTQVFAQKGEMETVNAINSATTTNKNNQMRASASLTTSEPIVAILTIFADPTTNGTGSSGTDGSSAFGTHAFITIRNFSNGNINVGKFSGITTGKTMSLGTWGNKNEHKGLWYNLESYFVYKNSSYGSRVSVSYNLTAKQLNTLNSFITGNDKWSTLNNCSNFAVKAWNSVVNKDQQLSAGTPSTPKKLADSIKAKYKSTYSTGSIVPWNYAVYYANGTGTPVKSTVYK